jgi:hypothetical protein
MPLVGEDQRKDERTDKRLGLRFAHDVNNDDRDGGEARARQSKRNPRLLNPTHAPAPIPSSHSLPVAFGVNPWHCLRWQPATSRAPRAPISTRVHAGSHADSPAPAPQHYTQEARKLPSWSLTLIPRGIQHDLHGTQACWRLLLGHRRRLACLPRCLESCATREANGGSNPEATPHAYTHVSSGGQLWQREPV